LVGIWVFDRVVRIVRFIYCNLHLKLSSNAIITKTTAKYDRDSDVITLEIIPGSNILKPAAGQFYFLYQPISWKGWENHPFTLASWRGIGSESSRAKEVVQKSDSETTSLDKEIQVAAAGPSSDNSSTNSINTDEDHGQCSLGRTFTFYVRPYNSWTKRLRNKCLKSDSGTINPRLFIEGAYGERCPLHTFTNLVFIVGGTGIATALPYLQEFMYPQTTPRKRDYCAKHITLIWTTKQSAFIRQIVARELQPLLNRDDVDLHFHATATPKSPIPVNRPTVKASEHVHHELEISHGRPDLRASLLRIVEDVQQAGAAGGDIGVLSCGPAGLADECRSTVHWALKAGHRNVEYFEETFG
jgi:ferric-chelate reductase